MNFISGYSKYIVVATLIIILFMWNFQSTKYIKQIKRFKKKKYPKVQNLQTIPKFSNFQENDKCCNPEENNVQLNVSNTNNNLSDIPNDASFNVINSVEECEKKPGIKLANDYVAIKTKILESNKHSPVEIVSKIDEGMYKDETRVFIVSHLPPTGYIDIHDNKGDKISSERASGLHSGIQTDYFPNTKYIKTIYDITIHNENPHAKETLAMIPIFNNDDQVREIYEYEYNGHLFYLALSTNTNKTDSLYTNQGIYLCPRSNIHDWYDKAILIKKIYGT